MWAMDGIYIYIYTYIHTYRSRRLDWLGWKSVGGKFLLEALRTPIFQGRTVWVDRTSVSSLT